MWPESCSLDCGEVQGGNSLQNLNGAPIGEEPPPPAAGVPDQCTQPVEGSHGNPRLEVDAKGCLKSKVAEDKEAQH